MELIIKASWALLALIHLSPAVAFFMPPMLDKLYGVDPAGDLGTLLTHRAALFLAIVVGAIFALFDPAARRLASVVVAISMVSFLVLYARAGLPTGPLRTIAVADLVGLLPLVVVGVAAWR
ncbi:MAG: phosphopantetheine adenylyltransferase [Parvularculaceae bacterium]|nr:phosphopantetheine adenylyltransferase [Parvularculaceae bacterium]